MSTDDFSSIVTETDLIRARLQIRARTLEVLQTLISCRREDWHFYLSKHYLLREPQLTEQQRDDLTACFAELERKHVKLRQDICNTIQLVRDLDNDSYDAMGSLPEH